MYLKSLELTGFKSFAKKTKLDFKTPISAIVGPNGSGKSNVAESFRFVLGEQSIKSLRGKKGEDLIFNGSKTVGKMNRGAVKVVFDNSTRFLDIDFDEVAIERVVHRDGSNQYFINDSQVRLRDVVLLLANANIGSSGHHIISQGEADRILNANIKERREMVEDALGLKVFQYKKQESEKKLIKTKENITHIQSLRKEIAPHIRFLKKQVEKVEKARAMRDELEGCYREYLKKESAYLTHEDARLVEAMRAPEDGLKVLEEKLQKAKEVLATSSQRDEKSDTVIALEESLSRMRREHDEVTRELGRVEGQIVFEEKQLLYLESQKQKESERTFTLSQVEAYAKDTDALIKEAEQEENVLEIRFILKRIKKVLEELLVTERGVEVPSEDVKMHEEELAKLTTRRSEIEVRISEIQNEENKLRADHTKLQQDIEAVKDENREAERMIFTLMREQSELRSTLGVLRAKKDTLMREQRNFDEEITEGTVLIGAMLKTFVVEVLRGENGEEVGADIILNEGRSRDAQEKKRKHIERLKIRLEDSGGGSGAEIEKEFTEVQERDKFLEREIVDLETSVDSLNTLIGELDEKLNTQFQEGVTKINKAFQEFFALMFGGGSASLALVQEKKKKRARADVDELLDVPLDDDEDEEMEAREGIDITVSLPHKKIKGLHMLSGGERALTSIALLFAMSQVNPPPFLVLDETDAALDEANSRRYGDMIKNLSAYSQLILITHNRETMSRAGILYGVTMGSDGISKLLSIEFDEAVEIAK